MDKDKVLEIEDRIKKLEVRNKGVELNKAWETSYTRRLLIAIFTYLAIALYLQFIVGIDPWINAIVPTIGFVLSTFTFPLLKNLWAKYIYKKKSY